MIMRWLLSLGILSSLGFGAWKMSDQRPDLKAKVEDLLNLGSFHTLELKYSANQVMENHRRELLKSPRHKYLEPELRFYPYLLMEVKYLFSEKTEESVILWDMCDGEMVLNTKTWAKTHGFGDCIKANTDRHEFKIINTISKKGGSCDREHLAKTLNIETDVMDIWVDSLRRKKLIVQVGNKYRLHMEDPLMVSIPSTIVEERLVTQSCKNSKKISKRFNLSQVEKISQSAFGIDFAIKHTKDVYLPVHCIVVQNPDGSVHSSLWNALNGKRVSYSHSLD
ncbi:MAG: hypothetical protein FJZ57_01685 [Chlamydiae bacterium]|nr:hypothetical protein [Chlamydiota bacterium]